jgi:hypothetical protein
MSKKCFGAQRRFSILQRPKEGVAICCNCSAIAIAAIAICFAVPLILEATIVLLLVTVGFAFFRLNNSLASRVGLGLRGKRA